jgi:vacuolar iron transporter family protein
LRKAVNIITSNKKRWLRVAMQEELGFSKIRKLNPFIGGFNSGVAYIIGAMFPLAPYLFFTLNTAIPLSIVLTAFGLFFVGAAKGAYTKVNWLKNGLEMLLVGGIAFIVGLIVGKMLSKI